MGKYLGVKWLGHMVSVCLTFEKATKRVWPVGIFLLVPKSSRRTLTWNKSFYSKVLNQGYLNSLQGESGNLLKLYAKVFLTVYTYICTIRVTGIPEGENEAKAVFVVIIAEKFAEYTKEIKPQIEEMLRFLNRVNIQKTTTIEHHI